VAGASAATPLAASARLRLAAGSVAHGRGRGSGCGLGSGSGCAVLQAAAMAQLGPRRRHRHRCDCDCDSCCGYHCDSCCRCGCGCGYFGYCCGCCCDSGCQPVAVPVRCRRSRSRSRAQHRKRQGSRAVRGTRSRNRLRNRPPCSPVGGRNQVPSRQAPSVAVPGRAASARRRPSGGGAACEKHPARVRHIMTRINRSSCGADPSLGWAESAFSAPPQRLFIRPLRNGQAPTCTSSRTVSCRPPSRLLFSWRIAAAACSCVRNWTSLGISIARPSEFPANAPANATIRGNEPALYQDI
jgi:hypothetical protein